MFNPKVKDFKEENPDQTMLGFSWSLYWRLQIIIAAIYAVVAIVVGSFD